jgi:hypothetical protein
MKIRLPKILSYAVLLKWITRLPLPFIVLMAAVTLFFSWHVPRLSFKTSIYDLVVETIPETARYEAFKEVFGSDEIIRIVIRCENVFDPVSFEAIRELSNRLSGLDGVRRIIGLPGIKKAIDVNERWKLDEFAAVISPVELFQGNLLSEDHRSTALTCILSGTVPHHILIDSVDDLIADMPRNMTLYQIGMPVVSEELARFTRNDFFRLPPVTFLLIVLVLICLFRKVLPLIISLGAVLIALVWTFGLMSLLSVPVSILTMIVPVFLIAVGTAYCLHIVSEHRRLLEKTGAGKTSGDAAFSTFTAVTLPTFLAILTTAIGLSSLLVNRISAIREFALFACFGMLSLLVIVLVLLPAILSLIPLTGSGKDDVSRKHSLIDRFLDRFLERVIDIDLNHQKKTLPLIALVVAVCVVGIFRIRVETNPVSYFRQDTEIAENFHDIYRDLSGSFPINLVMEAKEKDYFKSPENIAEISRIQEYLETLPGVDKTVSFADYMKLVNFARARFDPGYYILPTETFDTAGLIRNYRIQLGKDMLTRFMGPDFRRVNILLLTHLSSSHDILEIRKKILAHVAGNFPAHLKWEVTGLGVVISESNRMLTNGQVKSLTITMLLVFGIMFALFMSFRVGIIAIAPNLFPIIVNFGLMGWLGVELSMTTSLIAGIAIGLAVDDTIHYLVRLNRELKVDLDESRAFRDTIRHVGRPIIFTTVTISIGFTVLLFSGFQPTAIFGGMMVVTMCAALMGDLIILPSLIQHVEIVTLWDLVKLKLREDPHLRIPLFRGLSGRQVKHIMMAGALKPVTAGNVLFRKGDESDFMYVSISGELGVIDPASEDLAARSGSEPELLLRLQAGELVGEMGFIRSVPRTATVTVLESGELLQINWKMIKRLQWLYPPTAQKFFFNLLTIICDRLERTTSDYTATRLKN